MARVDKRHGKHTHKYNEQFGWCCLRRVQLAKIVNAQFVSYAVLHILGKSLAHTARLKTRQRQREREREGGKKKRERERECK